MILLRSFLSGHIRIKRTLEYYDAGIGPRVPFGGGFGPTVSANFAVALGDFTTLSSTSTMPPGGSISRAGNAMLYDSTGKLTYAPNNLLLYNTDFTQTAWNASTVGVTRNGSAGTAPDGTNSACLIQETTAPTSWHFILQTSLTPAAGVKYLYSAYVKYAGTRYAYIQYGAFGGMTTDGGIDFNTNTAVGSATVTPVGNGWYRVTVPTTTASAAAGGVYIGVSTTWPATQYTGSTSNGVLVWGAQLEAVTYQTSPSGTYYLNYPTPNTTSAYYGPRFDYDPVTLQPKGLLVEGQLQQLVSWSEDFRDTATAGSTRPWTNLNVTVSTGAAVGPAGSQTANSFFETAVTSEHQVNDPAISFAANTPYTLSVYVKSIGGRNCSLFWYTNSINTVLNACFDLSAGTIITPATASGSAPPANVSAAITSVGSGWYRVSITGTTGATAGLGAIRIHAASGTSNSYAGDITKGIYAFGAQLEARAFPTSYLPTQGGTSPFATRAAETFSLTGYANRLVEAYYIDEETGANFSGNSALSTGTVTINPPTFGWVTSLRAYTNAYAGSISTPSWLSFSRAGNATYYDSTGTLTYAPANLIQQSQTFNNVYWTKSSVTVSADAIAAPDGTTTADNIISTVGTGEQRVFANPIPSTVGIRYTYSVYAKTGGANWLVMRDDARGFADTSFDLVNGVVGTVGSGRTASILSVGSGWYRCSVTVEVSASWVVGSVSLCLADVDNGRATFVGNGAKSIYLWGAQLEPVTYQTAPSAYIPTTSAAVYGPRYDYDPSTVPATPRGLLIEEQRVNIVTASSAFTNAGPFWYQNDSPSATTTNLAPDGTATAYSWSFNTASTGYYGIPTFAANVTYAFSVYVKNISGSGTVRLGSDSSKWGGGANTLKARVDFNPSTGVFSNVQSGVIAYDKQNVGNGWWRIWFTATKNSTAETTDLTVYAVSAGTYAFWGCQTEHAGTAGTPTSAPFITSLIPTTTASVTRAADVAQLTGSALTTLQGATGTTIVEFNRTNDRYGPYDRVLLADDNTKAQYNMAYALYVGYAEIWSNGVNQILYSPVNPALNINRRGGLTWQVNNANLAYNGVANSTDTSVTIPTGINTGYLGYYRDSTWLNGYVRSMALYNQRLPNTILAQKSTVGAPY